MQIKKQYCHKNCKQRPILQTSVQTSRHIQIRYYLLVAHTNKEYLSVFVPLG